MPATWEVSTETAFEKKHVAALGRDEYDRRLAVANAKADELDDWQEQMFMRAQFQSVAMQMSAEQFKVASEKWNGDRWSRLIYRLATK